ncbi:hypothetical protein [Parendozoicomonas haliclonae]|uniref:Uncharacterized protein n=1 Tax=Parendozoicomonas haliclonae TaxID=1960125 RepID=A0A1X7APY5_9GAMM|nr:hypothetical protein [Parendozoicomonas haliclonae]SMA50203.1 hypothetical protein EHSB41UT_03996 [Parendozoicomonas haliclonae]
MPKVHSPRKRAAPYNIVNKPPSDCPQGCRCSTVSGRHLRVISREVTRILQGDNDLSGYPGGALSEQITRIELPETNLSTCYQQDLDRHLRWQGIEKNDYDQWQTRYQTLSLKTDDLLLSLTHSELNPRAIALEQDFALRGAEGFSCPELRTVVENMQRILAYEVQQQDCYAAQEIKTYLDYLQLFLDQNPSPSYFSVHGLCTQFIALMDEYESGLYKGAQDERRKAIAFIGAIKLGSWIDGMTPDELYHEGIFIKASLPILGLDKGTLRNRIIWPSFEPLTAQGFEGIARYNISPMGLLLSHMGFHDGELMGRWYFTRHDRVHDGELAKRRKINHRKCQSIYATRRHLLEKITTNPLIHDTCGKLCFAHVHELLTGYKAVNGERLMRRRELVDPHDDYADVAAWFTQRLHYFDDIPKGLTGQHIVGSCYLLNQIEPFLRRAP